MHAINTMLLEERLLVDAETYCRAEGFADYVFRDGPGFGLVLEAKKADATFVIESKKLPDGPVGKGKSGNGTKRP